MKMRTRLGEAVVVLAAAFLCAALATPAGERAVQVPVVDAAPVIDADLTDPCWDAAAKYSGFHDVTTGERAEVQTVAWLCRDETWLYVAFRCAEPNPADIKAEVGERDGPTPRDDSVEVFLDPGSNGARYYQIAVTAGNTQKDQRIDFADGKVKHRAPYWDLPFRSAARPDPHIDTSTGWSAELALPLAMLHELGPAQDWRMNLTRTRQAVAPTQFTSLAPLPAGSGFHSPEQFVPVEGITGFEARRVFAPMLGRLTASPYVVEEGRYAYEISATVKNQSGLGGEVELVVQDVPARGEGERAMRALDLGPVDEKTVRVQVVVDAPTARSAWAGVRLPEAEDFLQQARVRGTEDLVPFGAYLDRSYYTTEATARVYGTSTIDREGREALGIGMQAELVDPDGEPVAEGHLARYLYADQTVELPLTGLPQGESTVRVRYADAQGNVLGAMDLALLKRAPAPEGRHEVKIDRFHRCILIDGEPFFPYGRTLVSAAGDEGCFSETELDWFEAAGYNTVLDWNWHGDQSVERAGEEQGLTPAQYLHNGLDAARERGLYVIGLPFQYAAPTIHYSDKDLGEKMLGAIENVDWYVEALRTHPATVAYYSWDEPGPGIPTGLDLSMTDLLERSYQAVKDLDPYNAMYMSLSRVIHEPSWIGRTADILGTHNYWIADQPATLDKMAQWAYQTNEHLAAAHGPTMIMVYAQGGKGGGPQTHRERRAQVYLQLVHEARSMLYFGAITLRAVQESMEALAPEMHTLAPLLVRRSPAQVRTFAPEDAVVPGWSEQTTFPHVQTLLKRHPEGGYVLLAVSGSWRPVACRFEVSCLTPGSSVQRMFDDRRAYRVEDGAFEDTFAPLDRRAYRLREVAEPPRGEPVRVHLVLSGETLVHGHLPPPEEVARENLLPNPGFETPLTDAQAETEGIARSTQTPHSGDHCLRLVKDEAQGWLDWQSQVLTFKPNTTYAIGGWTRSDLRQGRRGPHLFVYDVNTVGSGKNRLNVTVPGVPVSQETWKRTERTFTTPDPPAVQGRVWCRVPDEAAGTVWFDDLFLEEVAPKDKNLIVNSSFEQDVEGFEGIPVKWPLFNFGHLLPHPDACGLTAENPHHGERCFRIPGRPELVYGTKCRQSVPVDRGTTYTLSAWMRADKPDTEVRLTFRDRYEQFTDVQVGTDWQRFSHTDTIPTEGPLRAWRSVMIEFWTHEANESAVYIDAVQFEEGEEPTEYTP